MSGCPKDREVEHLQSGANRHRNCTLMAGAEMVTGRTPVVVIVSTPAGPVAVTLVGRRQELNVKPYDKL